MNVIFHALFREITGVREIPQDLEDGSTLGDLVMKLSKKYGKDFNEILDPATNDISLDVMVVLNGESVRASNTPLKDNDSIMFAVPICGGR